MVVSGKGVGEKEQGNWELEIFLPLARVKLFSLLRGAGNADGEVVVALV